MWCILGDWCGLFCILLTWIFIPLSNYSAVTVVMLPCFAHEAASRTWLYVHLIVYHVLIFFILSTHTMGMITDPGTIPLGEGALNKLQGKSKGKGKGTQGEAGGKAESEEEEETDSSSGDGTESDDWHEDDTKARHCLKCCNIKPPLAHHCSICKRCVRRMDHHCPWINNCVGLRNHRLFLQFLVYTLAGLCYTMTLLFYRAFWAQCLGGTWQHGLSDLALGVITIIADVCFAFFIVGVMWDQWDGLSEGLPGIDMLKKERDGKLLAEEIEEPPPQGTMATLRHLFGEPFGVRWFLPLARPMADSDAVVEQVKKEVALAAAENKKLAAARARLRKQAGAKGLARQEGVGVAALLQQEQGGAEESATGGLKHARLGKKVPVPLHRDEDYLSLVSLPPGAASLGLQLGEDVNGRVFVVGCVVGSPSELARPPITTGSLLVAVAGQDTRRCGIAGVALAAAAAMEASSGEVALTLRPEAAWFRPSAEEVLAHQRHQAKQLLAQEEDEEEEEEGGELSVSAGTEGRQAEADTALEVPSCTTGAPTMRRRRKKNHQPMVAKHIETGTTTAHADRDR